MLYDYELTVPANTLEAAPARRVVIVGPGRITRVGVQFPAGCAGLVHARISRWGHQLWPTNPDGWLTANGHVIAWDDDVDVSDPPMTVLLEAHNLDDSYQHTLTFRFGVLAAAAVTTTAARTQSAMARALDLVFGRIPPSMPPKDEGS